MKTLYLQGKHYLIRTNFGAEEILRNWRNWPEIAKLNPRQIIRLRQIKSRQIKNFRPAPN